MSKHLVRTAWFDALTAGGTRSQYEWLLALRDLAAVDRIVDFGCCSAEPLILLWIFDATQIVVVELTRENVLMLEDDIAALSKRHQEAFEGRNIRLISPCDMSTRVNDLPSDYFDLAYCERVLYNMSPDFHKMQMAINEMTRVVRSDGFIIASNEIVNINGANQRNNLTDISHMFESAGLRRITLTNAPDSSYCYQKP